ncbi:MAG: aminotransferase class V-fold PLP-dependent enzyme [Aliishimia sp.]
MRTYLDHNATTPLRAEARAAMLAAMNLVGNPSSVHAEGRAATNVVERARAQVAALVGCRRAQVIFTSGATEAAALAVAQKARHGGVFLSLPTEHDCFLDWSDAQVPALVGRNGRAVLQMDEMTCQLAGATQSDAVLLAISAGNSETGLITPVLPNCSAYEISGHNDEGVKPVDVATVCDVTQVVGRLKLNWDPQLKPAYAILSAHKIGGPKGVGALINFTSEDPEAILRGGGQEMGRRSGTENTLGIAGFGAAAEAAARDVEAGKWAEVEKLRNILETGLEALDKETIFVGKDAARLPNTSCILTPGWKGETQVMQMDLAGFAISAGSACSSGKVKASKVLLAMGYNEIEASSAIRVSLGLETTEEDIARFIDAWGDKRKKHKARAA